MYFSWTFMKKKKRGNIKLKMFSLIMIKYQQTSIERMTVLAESMIILTVFVIFMGYLIYKLAYEDGY